MNNNIKEILNNLVNEINGITDIYIKGDDKISVRAEGELGYNFGNSSDSSSTIIVKNSILKEFLMENLKRFDKQFLDFQKIKKFDFRYNIGNKEFRVNSSISRGKLLIIFRVLNPEILDVEQLGIDKQFLKGILNVNQGLFLVSGPTGSGKSTTLSSLVNYYNNNYNKHIITLEDPIEQVYIDNKSVVHQLELGDDFLSYESGMENILRQDPDIIVIGEIRSKEVLDIALKLAETGHLVFATIHGKGANGVIGKIIRMYDNEKLISGMLADVLIGVLYQQKFVLDNKQTIVCIETLYNSDEVRAGFIQGKFTEFKSNMQSGRDNYMTTMEQYLENYLNKTYNLNGDEYIRIQNKIKGL